MVFMNRCGSSSIKVNSLRFGVMMMGFLQFYVRGRGLNAIRPGQ
jgi:hypothetical protein